MKHQTCAGRISPLLLACVAGCLMLGAFAIAWFRLAQPHPPTAEPPPAVDVAAIQARADRGEALAQMNLGDIYAKGLSVTQSYKLAAKWYRLAADQSNAPAQLALGELYEVGQGVPRDEAEAAKLYRAAAEQGNPAAQYSLAVLYVSGNGVRANPAEALKWYQAAAKQGDALAQYSLGMRFLEGRGGKADPVQAYQWLSLAADQGVADAVNARDSLKGRLTSEQLAEAKKLISEFTAQKPPTATR